LLSLPRLGGNSTLVLFVVTLIAFVVESQLAQVRVLFPHVDFSISHFSYVHSMYKARFAIDSRTSSCASSTSVFLSLPVETPSHIFVLRSYIVHSSFAFTFPAHLLYLVLTSSASLESLLAGLSLAVKIHFAPSDQSHLVTLRSPFPHARFLRLVAFLAFGVTLPSVLWFASVSLSP
jgi:hypothetical protein